MRVIIAGTRTITDYDILLRAMANCPFTWLITQVIVGCDEDDFKKGKLNVDVLGYVWAKLNRVPVHCDPVPPSTWRDFGKKAGPLRNRRMAQRGEGLIAVWDGVSSGTKSMIQIAQEFHLPVYVEPLYPLGDDESESWFAELLMRN